MVVKENKHIDTFGYHGNQELITEIISFANVQKMIRTCVACW